MFSQLFVNGLIVGSIYVLVALAFGLIYATTRYKGQVDLFDLFSRERLKSFGPPIYLSLP